MKLDQLRKIIREEVRAAVKEELQDVINEAVQIASTPSQTLEQPKSTQKKPSKQELAEMIGLKTPPKPTNIEFSKNESLNSILNQTKSSMTNEDYQQVINATSDMVSKPNFASSMANQMGMSGAQPGLDLSQLDFVSKAKSVYDASVKKDKQRAGQL